ncbi:MAG: abortive infection protein [Rhodospirillales bacterium]|nr:abortive infection protein [Rhodospirillales bacterium]
MTSIPSPGRPPRRLASIAGLILALVVPAILSAGGPGELPAATDATLSVIINEVVIWALTLALLGIVVFWERRSLLSIGLGRPSWSAIRAGARMTTALVVLAMAAGAIVQMIGLPIQDESQAALVMGMPIWLQLIVALSAGFTEETLFRGYAIERMTELTRSRWLGAIIPIVVFGAVHAPFWGVGHALVAGMSGLWLTVIYLWRRNLWTNITAHALLDGFVFVVMDIASATGTLDI